MNTALVEANEYKPKNATVPAIEYHDR